jgi:hypothetical protein
MAAQPEVIRSQIESTREELAHDLDRLADRTSPRRIAQRRWDSVKDRMGSMRERVMGVPHEPVERIRDVSEQAMSTVREAPEAVARTTKGNPLAAGLIAFGAGLLVASLLPETEAERRLAHEVSERVDALAEPLMETGRQVASDVGESISHAAGEVKETAAEAASTTAQRARETATS